MSKRKKFSPKEMQGDGRNSYFLADDLSLTVWIFSQATNTHVKAFAKALAKAGTGITTQQWTTLWLLLSSPGSMSLTEIAKFLPIEIHSVSALVEKLEKRGLIKRIRSKNDRRVVNIYLTETGFNILKKVAPYTYDFTMKTIGTLSKSQIIAFQKIARRMRDKDLEMLGQDPKHADEVLDRLANMTAESRHFSGD
jgi:DNA-binding MarR family transcriptional regulator